MDNKNIKKSDSSKILADKFLQIPWYDWRKFLANEKWARLAITGISGNRNFLLKLLKTKKLTDIEFGSK